MCKNSRIISRTKNGELSICKGCKKYSLIFNNALFQFNRKELNNFKKHINNIDVNYWLDFYSCTTIKRKIPLATNQQNLFLFFNVEEFQQLKKLLNTKNELESNLNASDINYPLILN